MLKKRMVCALLCGALLVYALNLVRLHSSGSASDGSSGKGGGRSRGARDDLQYYDELLRIITALAHKDRESRNESRSILDVGSAFPPFLRLVTSVRNKTVLAPYFVNYERVVDNTGYTDWAQYPDLRVVHSDFMHEDIPCASYDIVLCSQVRR